MRAEVEKLILYMAPKTIRLSPAEVTIEDVDACLAGGTQDATFEVWDRAATGDAAGLSDALHRAEGAGASLVGILRIAQGRLARLMEAAALIERGQPADAAIKSLRPPPPFPEVPRLREQLRRWDRRRLEWAAEELLAADLAAKRTGAPAKELIERAFLRIASRARG